MPSDITPPDSHVLVGHVVYGCDLDSFMWNDFAEFEKCPTCGFRRNFFGHDPKYRPRRKGYDYGTTYDGECVVSAGFRKYCHEHRWKGFEFLEFESSRDFYHGVMNRRLEFDTSISKRLDRGFFCPDCRMADGLHYRPPLCVLPRQELDEGFYRSDVLVGWGNRKSPFPIITPGARRRLEASGLTGFIYAEDVFAPRELVRWARPNEALSPAPPSKPGRKPPQKPIPWDAWNKFLAAPAPGFICRVRATPKSPARKTIQIHHRLGPPLTAAALKQAARRVGRSSGSLLEFYRKHDGAELFLDPASTECGVRLFPASEWPAATERLRNTFPAQGPHPPPDILDRCVAIGESSGSLHILAVVTRGPEAGSIVMSDHERLVLDELADGFSDLLCLIVSDPETFLRVELGADLAYRDGKTAREWTPIRYVPDARKPSFPAARATTRTR